MADGTRLPDPAQIPPMPPIPAQGDYGAEVLDLVEPVHAMPTSTHTSLGKNVPTPPTSIETPQPSQAVTQTTTNGLAAPIAQPRLRKGRQTRAGAPNYSLEDVNALLDIVEKVEPLGSNHWAAVGKEFEEWATHNSRPNRDAESLKNKFDKMANTKKKTGDPSCPAPVRRAKHIARAIQNKCAAKVLGSGDDNEDGSDGNSLVAGGRWQTEEEHNTVGTRQGKRKAGKGGIATPSKISRLDEAMLEHVGKLTEHIGTISHSFSQDKMGPHGDRDAEGIKKLFRDEVSVVREEVRRVREELKESLRPATEMMLQMKAVLEILSKSQQSPTSRNERDDV